MKIKKLFLSNYRNIKEAEINFCDRQNLIFGKNAQGKTNLLESVFYLSCLKTFRATKEKDVIMHGEEKCSAEGWFSAYGRDFQVSCNIQERGRKLSVNGIPQTRPSDHIGLIKTVVFSPDDLQLIKEGPSLRRRFMNIAISQMRPAYLKELFEHNKLIEHKKKIIKSSEKNSSMLSFLDVIDEKLSEKIAFLTRERALFLKEISSFAEEIMKEISLGVETLSLKYLFTSSCEDALSEENSARIFEHLKRRRQAEFESGMCLIGSHRDDFSVFINGNSARDFGSQGQIRSATLALKLAEQRLIEKDCGEAPILLLDDVLSELDPIRQSFLLNDASRGQTIITGCDPSAFSGLSCGRILTVENGCIEERMNK